MALFNFIYHDLIISFISAISLNWPSCAGTYWARMASNACFLFVLLFAFVTIAENIDLNDRSRLVVTKELLNRYIVEAKEVTILYTIYNLSPK